MRTTLDIADDVMLAARELAARERRSIGAVISDLARSGLASARVDTSGRFPVIRSPAGSPPITPRMVRGALDQD